MSEVGAFLLRADHRSILVAAHGEVPQGLRGALRRAGEAVHERQFYSILHKLLAKPPHTNVQKCIARLPALDLTKLRVMNVLPAAVCHAKIIESLDGMQQAKDVVTGMRLLVSRGVDEAELAGSIRQVTGSCSMSQVFKRWVLQCRAPDHPVPSSADYRPILAAAELDRVSRRYRNCARTYITNLLDEAAGHAFAEFHHQREGIIVHLTRDGGHWRIEGLFGPRNARPSPPMRTAACAYLADNGINIEPQRRSTTSPWDAVRRLMAGPVLDFLFDMG